MVAWCETVKVSDYIAGPIRQAAYSARSLVVTEHSMHRCDGMTVLELLLVLGIVAILALIAVPGLGRFVADLRMTTAVNAFVHAVHLARQEAHKRGTDRTLM